MPYTWKQTTKSDSAGKTGASVLRWSLQHCSLHGTDVDRLFAIKELQGADDLTGNEFARLLLERELRRLFPATPSFDDDGKLVNAEKCRG